MSLLIVLADHAHERNHLSTRAFAELIHDSPYCTLPRDVGNTQRLLAPYELTPLSAMIFADRWSSAYGAPSIDNIPQ